MDQLNCAGRRSLKSIDTAVLAEIAGRILKIDKCSGMRVNEWGNGLQGRNPRVDSESVNMLFLKYWYYGGYKFENERTRGRPSQFAVNTQHSGWATLYRKSKKKKKEAEYRVFQANTPTKNRHFSTCGRAREILKTVLSSYINPIYHVINFMIGNSYYDG